MDLEQTMRAAFVLREPRPDFEDVVMARLNAAAWRAAQKKPRPRPRIVLIVALLALSAAAAVLVARFPGSDAGSAVLSAQQDPAAVPLVARSAALASAPAAAIAAPALLPAPHPVPSASDVSQLCAAAAATPVPTAYTVLAALHFNTGDPALQSLVQDYYTALVAGLRKVPGLALAGPEAGVSAARPADYRITVSAADSSDSPAPAARAGPRLKLQLESWNGTAFQLISYTVRDLHSLDAGNCPVGGNCASMAGSMAAVNFVGSRLPQSAGSAQVACQQSAQQLFAQQVEQQRKADATFDLSMLRQQLERLAVTTQPNARYSMMLGIQRSSARLQQVGPLAAALRDTTDDAFRKEVVTLLAVKFASDPAAHKALAAVAASSTDALLRHVAERALSGDAPWNDYVIGRLRDTSLPAAQRLEPLYWMVDALPLDEQKMSASLAQVLATLQQGDGIAVLAELLAGTVKQAAEGLPSIAAQWGQRAIRQLGAVNGPAAPQLLIACFDSAPNSTTLGLLATRRDDARVAGRLEAIAAAQADPQLQRSAAGYLGEPLALRH